MLVKKGFDPYGRIEIRSLMAEMRGGGKFNIISNLRHFMSMFVWLCWGAVIRRV